MRDEEFETTIGTGGWVLVVLSGIVTFGILRGFMNYLLFPAVAFALAVALIVLLVLFWLAAKVTRDDDAEAAQRVRKIVPASGEGRIGAAEGAPVRAVPVRPEALKAQRPSSVVTPLAKVEPAPIIPAPAAAAPVVAADAAPTAMPLAEMPVAKPKTKTAARPKADPKAKPDPKAKAESKPKAEKAAAKPKAPKAAKPAGPVRLKAPRKGGADDLKEIEGIGPALEKLVNDLGFYHFDQIAGWTEADVTLVDAEMKTFKGRITRDKWVEQARIIVTDGLEAFRERAKTNDY